MENVLILGYDGYIGNALTQKLLLKNYKVVGVDNYQKRKQAESILKSKSVLKYKRPLNKSKLLKKLGNFVDYSLDISDKNAYQKLKDIITEHKITTIVNLAHNPSAPFSMIGNDISNKVLQNNIIGTNNIIWAIKDTNPNIHLINLGTTGEYDHYGNVTIQEGYFSFTDEEGNKSNEMIFPRRPRKYLSYFKSFNDLSYRFFNTCLKFNMYRYNARNCCRYIFWWIRKN